MLSFIYYPDIHGSLLQSLEKKINVSYIPDCFEIKGKIFKLVSKYIESAQVIKQVSSRAAR